MDFNIRHGLYGVEVDPQIRLEDIDVFYAKFIPAIRLKPQELDKLVEQSGRRNKLYPDTTLTSAKQDSRESYAALQKRLKKDFGKTAKEVFQGTWDSIPKPPAENTIQWWTNVFEQKSDKVDLPRVMLYGHW